MHVAITGASSGIGASLARAAHLRGHTLTLVARRKNALEEQNAALGGGAELCVADLSEPAQVLGWLEQAQARHGHIDVLVNNAGADHTGPALSLTDPEASSLMQLNLLAPRALIAALAPQMVARRAGAIINVASAAAFASTPGQAWYGASKAALAQFSEALYFELAPAGVKVLTVYPGPVRTPMADRAFAALGGREKALKGGLPEGDPDELATLVLEALEGGEPRVVYPGTYRLSYLFPWFARWMKGRRFAPGPGA